MPAFDFWLQHGDVVRLHDKRLGTIKFIGVLDNHALPNMNPKRPFVYYGLELDEPFEYGNNGCLDGIRYFVAEEKCGFFATRDQIMENIHAQFRSGERLKNWSRKVQRAERPVEREFHMSTPVSIQPSDVSIPKKPESPSLYVSRPKQVAVESSVPIDASPQRSPVLSCEPINITISDDSLPLHESKLQQNESKPDEVAVQRMESIDVSPLNNPVLLNLSKPTQMFVESEQPEEPSPVSLSLQPIKPDVVSLERPSELFMLNVPPVEGNLERPSEVFVHNFQPSNVSPPHLNKSKPTEVFVDSNQTKERSPVNNEVSLDFSDPVEVFEISSQPRDMSSLNDRVVIDDSDSPDSYIQDVQPDDVSSDDRPIPLHGNDSSQGFVHSKEPRDETSSNNEVLSDPNEPTVLFMKSAQDNNVNPFSAPTDLTRSQSEPQNLSIQTHIAPSLVSINIKPDDPQNVSIFNIDAEPDVEDGKVSEEEVISNEAVFNRMVKLAGAGFGSTLDEEVIKAKVSKLLRNLGHTSTHNLRIDDDNSEFSDMEGDGGYNGTDATGDESSDITDYGDIKQSTVRIAPWSSQDEDEDENEGGIFSGNTQFDENLLENMGMIKFEKMHYSNLRHHSHQLSQNYTNLPSFSSVIKDNHRKRSIFSGTGNMDSLAAPHTRRMASEPIVKMTNNDFVNDKTAEDEDLQNEDEHEKEQKTEENHDIDDKAKRLDIIDEQMKAIGEELTELTNESFKVLLDMGQANDDDSATLEKKYLKIEMKSQELRKQKTALDMERQELVDSVQQMMFASFDIMTPTAVDDPLAGYSGFGMDDSLFTTKEDEDMITSPPV